MMKKVSIAVIVSVVFTAFFIGLTGCGDTSQLGETRAEGRRRHIRKARIERQELMQDLDRIWMTDAPSKLSERRIRR